MDLVTNPVSSALRKFLRRLGLTALVKKRILALVLPDIMTEERVGETLLASVRAGDVVWDVGANIGLYAVPLADRVGKSGLVCAFEPDTRNLGALREAIGPRSNIKVFALALGDRGGEVLFATSGTTGHIVANADSGTAGVMVPLTTGDALANCGEAPVPAVIKIDTEGAEYLVLRGMEGLLSNDALRTVVVEVHFAALEAAGRGDHPKKIISLLTSKGFSTRWLDASHVVAGR
jgi:FkbM family methyltransferase